MTLFPLLVSLACLAAQSSTQANPCMNGSFEELAPNGFPVAWGPIGKAEPCGDAHSGRRALRLVRTSEPPSVETGVNSQNLARLRGGIDFYYKAVSGKDAEFHIYAFPITAEGVEGGAARAAYAVPKQHVGDGQWHHGRLKYDFTKSPVIKTVIFGARVQAAAGELLLDDFSYVERVGPLLRIGTIRIEEDPKQPGERGTVSAPIENGGDEPAKDVRVTIEVPKGLKATPADLRLGDIAPDGIALARCKLEGERIKAATLQIVAASRGQVATGRLEIAPRLVVASWGPTSPVFLAGQPITVDFALNNPGTAIVLRPRVVLSCENEFAPSAEPVVEVTSAETSAQRIAPGQGIKIRAIPRPSESPLLTLRMRASATNVPLRPDTPEQRSMTAVIVPAATPPPPAGAVNARATADYAIVENEDVRIVFRPVSRKADGVHFGEISVRRGTQWNTVAWIPQYLPGGTVDFPPKVDNAASTARLRFSGELDEVGPVTITFDLQRGRKTVAARYELQAKQAATIKSLPGPTLCILDRDEALFPGVEWLVGDELSSSSLDIAPTHPDRIRAIVHPNWITIPAIGVYGRHGTVGLLWDIRQKWDGTRDRPGVFFCSPDQAQNQRSHRIGLFLPNSPEFCTPNTWDVTVRKQYSLEPGKPIRLEAQIYADADANDALSAIDQWAKIYGYPKPAPLPRGSYEKEIEFSMQAYLKSLWVPEEQKWWTSKGGGMMSTKDRPRSFIADLLVGEMLSPDEAIRRQCRARAEEVLKLIGGQPRLDAQRFPGRIDSALADPSPVAGLLMSRREDGAWPFNADQVGTGPFVGLDYHDLGPNNAVEVGLCASKATAVLRYARITGDWAAYRQILKTLELMERFRVPRAAQVWEVPVHSPDILAAAEAAEAYIEAYRFSRDPRWLRDAVAWARRGLPFVYFWSDPQKPFLVGASIPVFGASWMQASWFGRPVQWNGLRYAEAILKLAEYDQTYPWRQIATAITHSAVLQQDTQGPNVALWPDSIGAVKGDKAGWVFPPQMILANVLKLLGRDPDLATVILGEGQKRLHVSAAARLTDGAWDGNTLSVRATYLRGEQGVVVVFNVAKPQAVFLDAKLLGERDDLESGAEPGWRYDEGIACLSIRIVRDGGSAIRIEGARFRPVTRLARLAERIAFEFNDSLEGWIAMHQVADLTVRDGTLSGKITGPDPYLGRSMLRVRGSDCPVIVLRMRVTAGSGGQCFWMTESSPAFTEDKSVRLNVRPDGQFHEYRLEVGKHPAWSGHTITGLRIDPSDGAPSGEFAIDFLRAGTSK